MKGYIIMDRTWHHLVRWCDATEDQPAALWLAYAIEDDFPSEGPTLFTTKKAARKAIAITRKLPYAWANNDYEIYKVSK